jgi:hypothetical protein
VLNWLKKFKEKKEINMDRGEAFEASLPKSDYFSDSYFDVRQLMAQAMQIKHIHSLNPKDIIEIGIGNRLTSTFIRNSGVEVVTAGINPNHGPDICCPMSEILERTGGRQFDLVVFCKVLEHMPLDQLERNIKTLRALGSRLFLTLPGYTRSFGFSLLIKVPFIKARDCFLYFFLPKTIDLSKTEHFWEVGSEMATKRRAIINLLKNYYPSVRSGRISFQPNQIYFIAE